MKASVWCYSGFVLVSMIPIQINEWRRGKRNTSQNDPDSHWTSELSWRRIYYGQNTGSHSSVRQKHNRGASKEWNGAVYLLQGWQGKVGTGEQVGGEVRWWDAGVNAGQEESQENKAMLHGIKPSPVVPAALRLKGRADILSSELGCQAAHGTIIK